MSLRNFAGRRAASLECNCRRSSDSVARDGRVGGRQRIGRRAGPRVVASLASLASIGGGGNGGDGRAPRRTGGSSDDANEGERRWEGAVLRSTLASLASSLALFAGKGARVARAEERKDTGMVLESWLSWLDKLVNECIDAKGNLDLEEMDKRFATKGGGALRALADRLWNAIDEGDVEAAEAIIESVEKDRMLAFGKVAIRSICQKDQDIINQALGRNQVWKLVQLTHFGSTHQQALARATIDGLVRGERSKEAKAEVRQAEADIKVIHSVLGPYQDASVKKLARLVKWGTKTQKIMAAQALNGLCGMGLSEEVAKGVTGVVRELVALLKEEVEGDLAAMEDGAGTGWRRRATAEGGSPERKSANTSPLLAEWIQDFSLPPKISLAGLFGALGTHKPEALQEAVGMDVLGPLKGMLRSGSQRERDLVASLLLVMMTASESAWLAAKSTNFLAAPDQGQGERSCCGSKAAKAWPLLSTCLSFDGTHQELADHMLELSRP